MKSVWLVILCSLAGFHSLWTQDVDSAAYESAYESGENKIKSGWGFDIQISTDGFVLGGLYHKKISDGTFITTSLEMFWVRGKDEGIGIDPVTGITQTINSETILVLPLQFSLKRRIFSESVSNTLRPYLMVGIGGVYGIYISSDQPKSNLPKPQDGSQFAPTASFGLGADFGKPGTTGYGLDMKYQLLRFNRHLGARKNFDNLQIGFHVNF